jgi:hypothetical protein
MTVAVGEGLEFTRSFTVQVDTPTTPLIQIVNAIGIGLWASHPEDYFSRAQKFDVKPRGSSLLLYEVTVHYKKVDEKNEDRQEQKPGEPPKPETEPAIMPKPVWSGGTTSSTQPFTVDANGKPVTNSAGVPFPDAEKKVPTPTLSLVRPYPSYKAMNTAVGRIVGRVNSAPWAGGDIGEWLCESTRWSWKSEGQGNEQLRYVECQFDFAFQEDGWAQKLLDVGYQQKVDDEGNPSPSGGELAPILGQDGKPVKEPVGLNGQGVAMSPPPSPTNPPLVINNGKGAMPYKSANFSSIVGSPS